MYKELLYWEKKQNKTKKQGRLHILGRSGGVVGQAFPAPISPGAASAPPPPMLAGKCQGRQRPRGQGVSSTLWPGRRIRNRFMKANGESGHRSSPRTARTHRLPSQAAWYQLARPTAQEPESWPVTPPEGSVTLGGWLGHKGRRRPGKTSGMEAPT